MSKHSRPLTAFLSLTIVLLACVLPVPSGSPTQGPGTPSSPPSPDPGKVGTVVALTLTALVPPDASPTATVPAPNAPTDILPHTLYYLAPDNAGITQVFRMGYDGIAQYPITSESVDVSDYDVSPVDGSVAYVSDNQIFYIHADGTGRRALIYPSSVDPNNPFMSTMSSPVFSLDGQTLAYAHKGLQIYSFATDTSKLLIKNLVDDVGNSTFVPRELYAPQRYSADGTKLLINLSYYEGGSSAIYYPATNDLVRLNGGEGALICCNDTKWSFDGSSIYAASPTLGMFNSGLWRVDAATGQVTTLIQADAGGGNYNLADEAYLAPDGQLYFFFATIPSPEGMITRSPLQLVRSAPDGVTGRTVLSGETFELLNEALWAPDASFVILTIAPAPEIYQGGQAAIVYLDGRASVVLVPFARQMKWGP